MTVKSIPIPSIPEQTKVEAKAAFPKGNVYTQMRDEIGSIYKDDLFVELYSVEVVGESFRYPLNVLATVAPDWLRERLKAE